MTIFPTRILLATDGSEDASLAAQTAVELANKTDSELHVIYVGELDYGYPTYDIPDLEYMQRVQEKLTQEARKLLDAEVEQVKAAGAGVVEAHLSMGSPEVEIVKLAEEMRAGLIVVGSRGLGGLKRALMGSVSDSVVRHAHCPVLVARAVEKNEKVAANFPTKILLATDGSKEATLAARTAADLANKTDSELHLVNSRAVPMLIEAGSEAMRDAPQAEETARREAQEVLDAQVEQIEAVGGEVTQGHAALGHPVEQIVILAEEIGAGLIVMGSRGLGGMRRALIGSVSESVVRHAHCPVMVVRREE